MLSPFVLTKQFKNMHYGFPNEYDGDFPEMYYLYF